MTSRLGYLFRRQETSDYGVDAQVEIRQDTYPTGRLIGLQIKSGSSWFSEEAETGWRFRPEDKHVGYWLGHSLPIFVVLVDLDSETIYWQHFSQETFERGPRGGRFVLVPRTQTLDTAAAPFERAANRFAETVATDYADNLARLSPATAAAVQQYATCDSGAAAVLAAHLARGRGSPELIVRTLLTGEPSFLGAGEPGQGLQIVAEYAHSHTLDDIAAEALLRAAEQGSKRRYRYVRNAGLMLLDIDRARAGELLEAAAAMNESGADDPRLELGFAALDHPVGSAVPIALSPELEEKLRAVDDDEMILAALARRAEHGGDLQTAVVLAENALTLGQDSAALMDTLAEILARRARTAHAQPGDQARAIRLATAAVDQLHRWSGPTQEPLDTLLRTLMTAGRFGDALDRALPSPDGQACNDEAIRPSVQLVAAIAAMALDRFDLSARIIDSMPPGLDRDIARLRTTSTTDANAWLDLLDRLDEAKPEALLQAVMRLSDIGVDRSTRLNKLVELGMISAIVRDVAAAVAAAVVDLDAGLPRLRLLAETDEMAAAKLVYLLSEAGWLEDAQTAARVAYIRFRNTEFAVQRAKMLRGLGRISEAIRVATDALSDARIDPYSRRFANGLLGRLALDEANDAELADKTEYWQRAERHLRQCVSADDGGPVDDGDVWQLADVQVRLGSFVDAFQLLTQCDPAINDVNQARLWLSVMQRQPALAEHLYPRMLDLADQFSDDAQLSGALLTTVIMRTRDEQDGPATPADSRLTLPDELRAAAFVSLQAHVERHGEQSPFRVVHAPTQQELIEQMTAVMRRDTEPLVELLELVRQARLPLGLLASAGGRPYASTLAIRPLGYYLATASIEDDATLDEESARQAPGHDVVIDESALLVANLLGEYDKVRGNYRGLLMPAISRDDLTRARADLDSRSASSGFVTYDPVRDSIVASELDIDDHLIALTRLATMEQAVSPVQLVASVDLASIEEAAMAGSEAWLAPIALAKERQLPLWSDDVAQRRLARHFGVQTFSTTATQQIRADDEMSDPGLTSSELASAYARRRHEVMEQLAQRVVDPPVDAETVVEVASNEAWDETVALVTVGRPGWWHAAPNPWMDLHLILVAAASANAGVDPWLYHAMWGAARLTSDEPSRVAMLLAAIALLALDDGTDDALLQHFKAADAIAKQRKAHNPVDFLADAATTLANAGVIDNPAATVERVRALLNSTEDEDSADGQPEQA